MRCLNVDADRLQRRLRTTLPYKKTFQKTDEQGLEIIHLAAAAQRRRTQRGNLQFQLAAEKPVQIQRRLSTIQVKMKGSSVVTKVNVNVIPQSYSIRESRLELIRFSRQSTCGCLRLRWRRSCSTPGPVTTWMGDYVTIEKPGVESRSPDALTTETMINKFSTNT